MIVKIALSILIITLLNYFMFLGTESISTILGGFAILIIVLLIAIIGFGFGHVNTNNYHPFITSPLIMLFVAFFFIVETFFGWENATFMAEETKDAEKVIPRALLWSSIFVSILGILLAVVMLGVIPWQILGEFQYSSADLTSLLFNSGWAIVIKIGVALALIGSAAGGLVGRPKASFGSCQG